MKNTFVAGSRVYNFEIRQSTTGVRYLVIDEIQAEDSHRLMVFEEYWDGFLAWLIHIIGEAGLTQNPPIRQKQIAPESQENTKPARKIPDYVQEIRRAFPRAYEPWTPEEELRLATSQKNGSTVNQLAQEFQRQPSAIKSRLRKINLQEAR